MWSIFFKTTLFLAVCSSTVFDAQLFRTKDRMDNLEGFDQLKFSYGFYLTANNFDYKLVLEPKFGMNGQKSLVQTKSSYSFGAGLIGKFRLNDNFDLRIEPGLQFIEREIFFDTQSNDQYSAGTPSNVPFSPRVLTDADKLRTVKSTYVDIPLLIEIHGDRWYNTRPYAAAGVNWMVNLQSNSNAPDDNSQGLFRTTTSNFAWTAELGIQFYFSRFKLTPGFRGTFMINNELVADDAQTPPYWSSAISSAKSRAFMFVLKFE
jgi:hypothetical protein